MCPVAVKSKTADPKPAKPKVTKRTVKSKAAAARPAKPKVTKRTVKSKAAAARPVERSLQIGEARTELPNLVRAVESSPARYTIGKLGIRSAMVVSYQRVEPLFREKIEPKLALVIVQQLLGDAPLHLSTPAIEELSKLRRHDLLQILNALPLNKKKISDLKKEFKQPDVLDRLIRRFELAKKIAKAHEAGLYEASEHYTSKVRL